VLHPQFCIPAASAAAPPAIRFALGVVIPDARVLSDLDQDDENLASCLLLSASGSLSDTSARDQNSSAQRRSDALEPLSFSGIN